MKSLSGSNSEDEGILAAINVIPFVDIVLVLLVIFMLTSAAIMRAQLKVDLPKAASAGSAIDSTINLVYTRSNELLLNGKKTTFPAAAAAVRGAVKANPKTRAVISADRGVDYGRVVDVIDLVNLNGISAFALDVERRAPDPATSP
ncbi:MAG TPA: biopolymer transporter ExbD [Kofleriaceae bacterium]|nr:biopolymer transporter ExbD [Kofleriaceae bacterium]